MIDTQNIDCFVQSLTDYMQAKKERDKCYAECEYSAGYYCYQHDNAVADAAENIKKFLALAVKDILNE